MIGDVHMTLMNLNVGESGNVIWVDENAKDLVLRAVQCYEYTESTELYILKG